MADAAPDTIGNAPIERPLALITGASSGIGREFARQAARHGCDVVLVARRADLAMIRLNVTALVHLTGLVLPTMIRRGRGAILNVASIAGYLPGPGQAVDNASKAFVKSFSEALSEETNGTGVRIVTLCPGPVRTEFMATAGFPQATSSNNPTMKVMPAAEVAAAGWRALQAGGRGVIVPDLATRIGLQSLRVLPWRLIARRAGPSADQAAPQPRMVHDGLAVYGIGSGEPILLMPGPHRFERPGLPGTDALINGLVQAGRLVLTFDPPGSGRSRRPARLSMGEMKDCADEALDALGITDPIDAIGHSMGGLALLAYALDRPHRVRRLEQRRGPPPSPLVQSPPGHRRPARCGLRQRGRDLGGGGYSQRNSSRAATSDPEANARQIPMSDQDNDVPSHGTCNTLMT